MFTRQKVMVVFIVMMVFPSIGIAEETLHFAMPGGIKPIGYEEDGVKKGLAYDLFLEAKKRLNVDIELEFMPFKRISALLQEGELDGTTAIYYQKEREEWLVYSNPMYYSRYNVFVNQGQEFDFQGIEDLYGKKVGKQSGWSISKEFENAVNEGKITVEEATNAESSLKMLTAGRIDAYIAQYYITMFSIKELGLQGEFVHLPKPVIEERGVYWALSKQGKRIQDKSQFIEELNRVIEEIHSDGTLEKIEDKYLK